MTTVALVCACADVAAPSDSRAMETTAASALRAMMISLEMIPGGTGAFMVRTHRQRDVGGLRSVVKLCFFARCAVRKRDFSHAGINAACL